MFLPPLPTKLKADPNSKRSRKKFELERRRQQRALDHPEDLEQELPEPESEDEEFLAQPQQASTCTKYPEEAR
eukprot:6414371-Pyramimonas_sp.AAC.1